MIIPLGIVCPICNLQVANHEIVEQERARELYLTSPTEEVEELLQEDGEEI